MNISIKKNAIDKISTLVMIGVVVAFMIGFLIAMNS